MRLLSILTAVILGITAVSAHAFGLPQLHVVESPENRGGSVTEVLARIEHFRENGTTVILQGECISSCTLYTSLLRDDLLCAMPGTMLVFHQFRGKKGALKVRSDGTLVLDDPELKRLTKHDPLGEDIQEAYPGPVLDRLALVFPKGFPRLGHEQAIPASLLLVPECSF